MISYCEKCGKQIYFRKFDKRWIHVRPINGDHHAAVPKGN